MSDDASSSPASDPQQLARLLVARERAGDVEGMVALYEHDAVLDIGGGRLAVGSEAIRAFYASLIAAGVTFELADQHPAIINGNVALTSTRLPDGSVTAEVARRQDDGTWRWAIDQPAIARPNRSP